MPLACVPMTCVRVCVQGKASGACVRENIRISKWQKTSVIAPTHVWPETTHDSYSHFNPRPQSRAVDATSHQRLPAQKRRRGLTGRRQGRALKHALVGTSSQSDIKRIVKRGPTSAHVIDTAQTLNPCRRRPSIKPSQPCAACAHKTGWAS